MDNLHVDYELLYHTNCLFEDDSLEKSHKLIISKKKSVFYKMFNIY